MKKFGLVLTLSLCIVLSLSACGKKTEKENFDTVDEVSSEVSIPGVDSTTEANATDTDVLPDQKDIIDSDEKWQEVHGGDSTEEVTEENTDLAEETNVETDSSEMKTVSVTGDDTFGSIEGVAFDLKKGTIDFTETFGKAGFTFSATEDTYSNASVYPLEISNGNASISATVEKIGDDWSTDDNSVNSIINEGFNSYCINVKNAVNSSKPYMTFKGCTWGSTVDDVIAAYGKPLDYDEKAATKNASVRLAYDYEDYTIEFTVYNPSSGAIGLQEVYVYPRSH